MTPEIIALIVGIAKELPSLAIELVALWNKGDPTDADWDALIKKYEGKTFNTYMNEAEARAAAKA